MAIPLTEKNKTLSQQISINPQAILEIEGLDVVFGAQPVVEFARWDSGIRWDQPGVSWDGSIEKEGSRDVIMLDGTTNEITQQIKPDKGGSTSVSTVNIQMIDEDNEIAQIFSFDNIQEILGKKANFYIGFKQSEFPESAIPIFRGVVVDFYTKNGAVMVSIAHPESLKRSVLYQQFQTQLDGSIDGSQTTINLIETEDLFPSSDTQTTCIRIGDEVMRVVSIDSPTQVTVERGFETTIAQPHSDDSDVTSVYILEGKPLELALKLMLSSEDNAYFLSDEKPSAIENNRLIFDYYNIQDLTGLVEGDFIQLTGPNAGVYTISEFGFVDDRSYIEVSGTLTNEVEFTGTFEYKSQYAVLGDGLGMLPFQVDVQGHIDIERFNPSLFVDYKFYLKETIEDPQDFISSEIYFPQGLYAIPRNARSSVKQVNPPLSVDIVPTINTKNITNINNILQRRSIHKYLYNIYRYDYNEDIIEDKTLKKRVIVSQDSLNRIKAGRKQLRIESKGLRDNAETNLNIDQVSQRLIDRYRFAPTYFENVEIKYQAGFNLEVGDVLPFLGEDTQAVDLKTGLRNQTEKLFEIANKKLNIKTGKITVDLLETAFNIRSRSAVISPSSLLGPNSTTTRLELKTSFSVGEFDVETEKWSEFIGQRIRVRSDDYTQDEVVTVQAIDPTNNNFLLVSPALSFLPLENYIIEVPEYDNTSNLIDAAFKLRFAYFNSQVEITSVADAKTFDVDEPGELAEGSEIYVHSVDYTRDSFGNTITIESIVGNTVTLSEDLPFLSLAGDKLEFSDYLDGGFPYQII